MVGVVYTALPEKAVFLGFNTIPAKKLNHACKKVHVSGVMCLGRKMRMRGDNTGISVKETNQHWCDM